MGVDLLYVFFVVLLAGAAFLAYRGRIALGLLVLTWFASVTSAIAVFEMTASMERALLAAAATLLPALPFAFEVEKGHKSVLARNPQLGALAFGSCLLIGSLGYRFAAGLPVLNWSQGGIVVATIIVFLVSSAERRKS
jgi:hypothetical protein